MESKELLKNFRRLPEREQNKILVDAYAQIARLHDAGKSFDSFGWENCVFENGILTIDAPVDNYFNEESFQRNLNDYGKIIYCLATGNKSGESMGWDAGRKIQSDVLREIVLTICGRNVSIEPLIEKLRQPYVDEDKFFEGYTTVAEKEGFDAAEKQRRIDEENRAQEQHDFASSISSKDTNRRPWAERIGIFIVMALCYSGYKAYRYYSAREEAQHQQVMKQVQQTRLQEIRSRAAFRNVTVKLPARAKSVNADSTLETIRKRLVPDSSLLVRPRYADSVIGVMMDRYADLPLADESAATDPGRNTEVGQHVNEEVHGTDSTTMSTN